MTYLQNSARNQQRTLFPWWVRSSIAYAICAALVAGLVPSPLSAQAKPEAPLGTRIPRIPDLYSTDMFPTDDSRVVVTKFAGCVVRKEPALARELMASRAYVFEPRFMKLASSECLSKAIAGTPYNRVTMAIMPTMMRYAIAEQLIETDLATYDPAAIASAAPLAKFIAKPEDFMGPGKLPKRPDPVKMAETGVRIRESLAFVDFGECVVRASPSGAKQLLQTRINSAEEGNALYALMPAFRGCLDKGHQFETGRAVLRGLLALSYYRLAYAPRVAAGAALRP